MGLLAAVSGAAMARCVPWGGWAGCSYKARHCASSFNVDDSPEEALRVMVQQGIKRLPVVDGNGRLVGLLGRASLLRALVVGA